MHIKDMLARVHGATVAPVRARFSAPPPVPVAMEVVLEEPVARTQHLVDGVQRIKETPWYRALRRRGLHFVPLGHREGAIVIVVGTAASLGAAYLVYKRLKSRHAPPPAASPEPAPAANAPAASPEAVPATDSRPLAVPTAAAPIPPAAAATPAPASEDTLPAAPPP